MRRSPPSSPMRHASVMQRIVIVGRSGSGKSTLARALGECLGLPVTHLDALYWQPGWQPTPDRPAFDARVLEIVAGERWIIDGGYTSTLPQRLRRADTVVVMMAPLWLCLRRVLWRLVAYRGGRTRPDMAPGCPEKVDLEFLGYILSFRRKSLPEIEAKIAAHFAGEPVRLWRPSAIAAFVAQAERDQPKIAPMPRQMT